MTKKLLQPLVFIVLLIVSCETKDGVMFDRESLGYEKCETDFDCGTGRFCDESNLCAIECSISKDCNSKYSTTGKMYECSPCGRCVPEGEKDKRCINTNDVLCETNDDCTNHYSSNSFSCHNNFCTLNCSSDSPCKRLGMGYSCNKSYGICFRKCFSNNDCYIHGWQYECQLSNPVNTDQNEKSIGECVPRIGGIDWGEENNPIYTAHQYEGVWGFAINAAMTIKNVPFINIQNTVLKSLLLVKIIQRNEDIEIYKRWCQLQFENFDENNPNYEDLAKMVVPENYIINMPVVSLYIKKPPELKTGSSFVTDKVFVLFGARLKDLYNDPLPDRENPENQSDDDKDNKPGVTVLLSGLINGEIYSVQRFWTTLNVEVVDSNHLQGLIDFNNELSIINAKPEILYYRPIIEKYKDPSRSYFRAVKIKDTSSCKDVIELSKNGWLKYEKQFDSNFKP